MPLLSILLPTFNRSAYLRECLDSLLATTVDCEIIISDNASPDDTPQVVASYTDPRIRYFRQATNIGPTANFNYLLGAATGTYCCLFGDDDAAMPGCFEPKVGLLEAHPHIDMVYSQLLGMDATGNTLPNSGNMVMGRISHSYIGGRNEFNELFVNCYISWQTLVFRRRLLAEVGDLADGWGLHISQDWYWLQLLTRGRETAFIAEPTVLLRFHSGSISNTIAAANNYFAIDRLDVWKRWLLIHPDPPVVSELVWDRMVHALMADVRDGYGNNAAKREENLQVLAELKIAYRQRMNARVQALVREVDPYQPGATPWPLDGVGKRAFLYFPRWDEPGWREVLAGYLAAFTPADEVSLVLALDPRQGLTSDEAGARVEAVLAEAGVAEPPDLLLVPEPADEAAFARLYAACDVVVAVGDRLAAARAHRLGKDLLLDLAPASWRRA